MAEAIVVVLLGAMMFLVVQTFFSHGVRTTTKGTDALESIRAASNLLSSVRADLGTCSGIDTYGAVKILGLADTTLDGSETFAETITFSQDNATVTYSLATLAGGGKEVCRKEETLTDPPTIKKFGVPRMAAFEVLSLKKRNKIGSVQFELPYILVRIRVKSNDPRFPTTEVALSSVLASSQLSASNWNPVF